MMYFLQQFVLGMFATAGFCVIFKVPWRHTVPCMVVGAAGWIAYVLSVQLSDSPSIGCFWGACTVGLLSMACSVLFKDATTIFVIPGILCLVPGNNIFLTMKAFMAGDYAGFAQLGGTTLMMAGSIALGLMVTGAVLRVVRSIVKTTAEFGEKAKNVKKITKRGK